MELDHNSAILMDRLNSITYNSKSSHTFATPLTTSQKRQTPLQQDSTPKLLTDQSGEMLDNSIEEFKNLLNEICQESNTLLKKFQSQIPETNLRRLEAMVPKLNEARRKVSRNLASKIQTPLPPINGKRDYQDRDEENDDIVEVKPMANGFKKVKADQPQNDTSDVILLGAPFRLTFICHSDVKSYFPPEKTSRYGSWSRDSTESEVILKREDFLFFPDEVCQRLSKEHARVKARKMGKNIDYEITDTSINGTFYLGNRTQNLVLPAPQRLQKGLPFKLKDGDCFCLLLKKVSPSQSPEVLLGFQFNQAM